MPHKILITESAHKGVATTFNYIFKSFGLKAANDFLEDMLVCYNQISTFPEMGVVRDKLRLYIIKKHTLVYYKTKKEDFVIVIAVVDARKALDFQLLL